MKKSMISIFSLLILFSMNIKSKDIILDVLGVGKMSSCGDVWNIGKRKEFQYYNNLRIEVIYISGKSGKRRNKTVVMPANNSYSQQILNLNIKPNTMLNVKATFTLHSVEQTLFRKKHKPKKSRDIVINNKFRIGYDPSSFMVLKFSPGEMQQNYCSTCYKKLAPKIQLVRAQF